MITDSSFFSKLENAVNEFIQIRSHNYMYMYVPEILSHLYHLASP